MFHRIKKIFSSPKNPRETIEELEQKKCEMEAQLELLIELEKEIKKQQQQQSNS